MKYNVTMVYTIGYAGVDPERLVEILKEKTVKLLVDVRSAPFSKQFWRFDELNIVHILGKNGIAYQNWKSEFGARQSDATFYTNGIMDFEKFAKSEQFQHGVSKMCAMKDFNVCLMCAEIDPINCHRAILCAKNLSEHGLDVVHIIAKRNGQTIFEPHKEFEQRLLNTTNANSLNEAYKIQNAKIGHKM